MLLNRAGEDPEEYRPTLRHGDDLCDGGVGFLIAHDEEASRPHFDSGRRVAKIRVRQTLFVSAVVVDPQIPLHTDMLRPTWVLDRLAEAPLKSQKGDVPDIRKNDVVVRKPERGDKDESRSAYPADRREADLPVAT